MSLAAVKERQQETWASGDYSKVANLVALIGELLCEAADLRAGQKVLDVATGSGNTALAAARRFCEVTGIDYVPALLDRARERARAERLDVAFLEGDAEDIPFPDASFDVVLSTLGTMFAPDQERAAAELLRVCRPGGKVGLANWTPDGFVGGIFATTANHVPPPTGLRPPVLWGTEERLQELLGSEISSLQITRRSLVFRAPSPEFYLGFMRTFYGPTLKAFQAIGASGQEALARDLLELIHRFNRSGDGTLAAPADYLEAVAVRASRGA